MNELTITKELAGLEPSKAKQIEAVFAPMVKMLKEFEAVFDEIIALEMNRETCIKAKRLRLDIAKVRITADKVRKIQKEEYLRAGNAIQGIYNILKFAVADKEDKLKEIETHYERIESEKKTQLQLDRQAELEKYEADGEFVDLGNMPDEVWKNYLAGVKNNYASIKEAERKAEEERIEREKRQAIYQERKEQLLPYSDQINLDGLTIDTAEETFQEILQIAKKAKVQDEVERAKIKADNERLRIEAEKAEKKRIADQKKAEAERIKQEEKLKVEREAQEKKLRTEREKAEAEKRIQDEIIRKEREAREKFERETREKEVERLRLEKEKTVKKAAAEKKAQLAPDKEKLTIIATDILIKIGMVSSAEAKTAIKAAHDIILNAAERM